METIKIEELRPILGKTCKDTVVVDPVLGPYFILRYEEGGFGVMKTRRDGNGNLKYRAMGYPSSFVGCLEMVAKEILHEGGKSYESIQAYISAWKEVSNRILNAYKDWNVKLI